MRVVREVALLDQRRHLLGSQTVAGPHRGMARHQTQQSLKSTSRVGSRSWLIR